MPSLIDADELVKGLELMAKYQPEHKQSTILGICATIKAAHTIDAEPVRHGRWIYKDDNYFICSFCRKYEHMLRPCWGLKRYCPNCGTKMDLEEFINDDERTNR